MWGTPPTQVSVRPHGWAAVTVLPVGMLPAGQSAVLALRAFAGQLAAAASAGAARTPIAAASAIRCRMGGTLVHNTARIEQKRNPGGRRHRRMNCRIILRQDGAGRLLSGNDELKVIRPRENGGGGPCERSEVWWRGRRRKIIEVLAPSTILRAIALRMVPLPRFAGQDTRPSPASRCRAHVVLTRQPITRTR